MGLLNKFYDTIFLKRSSNLKKDIDKLKELRNKLTDTTIIDKDIKLLEIGLQGEKEIEFELSNANLGMYVLHDVNIKFENSNAQIDYIIVTKAYTYLVECKNMIGNVSVNEHGEFRREYNYNGQKVIEGIYSPYNQAMRHKEILKKIWLAKNNKFSIFLWEKAFDNNYKPLVVLTNPHGLINLRWAPKEIKNVTIRCDGLIEYIKRDIANYNSKMYSSQKDMERLANSLLNQNVIVDNINLKKYQQIEKRQISLIDKLKTYRRNKAKNKNIPAYYIFTDRELEQIIKTCPRNFEDLVNSNILSPTKLKLHGAEIIKIINSK